MAPVKLLKGKLRKSTLGSGGYDLFATESNVIPVGCRLLIPTGVVTTMEANVVGIIKDRSGLAAKNGITTFAGVIDSDFADEWKVIAYNSGNYPLVINAGDRVAQVYFCHRLDVEALGGELELPAVERTGGLGSTGI